MQTKKEHLSLEIMLTYRCNFRCAYCYEKPCEYQNVDITDETKANIFKYIENKKIESPNMSITIFFWGGEPTLKLDIVEEFVEKYKNDSNIDFLIFTNGLLIDKLIPIYKNSNNKLKIQISYDFFGQYRREIASGKPSKEYVLEAIEKCISENMENVFLKSTILLDDLPYIDKFYSEYLELRKKFNNNKTISLALTVDTTTFWNKSESEFDTMLNEFQTSLKVLLKTAIKEKAYNFNWFYEQRSLCTAGDKYMMVDINGDIYPCHGTVFLKNKKQEHCLGHITETNKSFNLDFDVFDEPDKCKECDCKVCFRCNAHIYMKSNKKTKKERWLDFNNSEKACKINREISKMSYAFEKILQNRRGK